MRSILKQCDSHSGGWLETRRKKYYDFVEQKEVLEMLEVRTSGEFGSEKAIFIDLYYKSYDSATSVKYYDSI